MSYTHAQVSWESCTLDNNSIVNKYGDIVRKDPVNIIARKQPHSEVITDETGKTYLTKSIYYVDPKVEANTKNIRKYDKLDGDLIINVYEMRDLYDQLKMIRFITV